MSNTIVGLFVIFTIGAGFVGIIAMATAPRLSTPMTEPVDITALEEEVLAETGYDMADRIEREFDESHPDGKHIVSWICDSSGNRLLPVYSDEDPIEAMTNAEIAYKQACKAADNYFDERMSYDYPVKAVMQLLAEEQERAAKAERNKEGARYFA